MSKYDKIQREKLSAKGKEIYDKLRKASSGFKKTEGKVGVALDKFYGKVEATAVKEEKKVVKAVKKAEPKAKAKAKPKAKAKKKAEPKTKKPAYKNVNQGRYAKLVAKMSKEEGISYKEAQKKASKQIRDEKDSKRKESKDKFDNLISHLRTKKGFEDGRGLDRTEEDRKHKIGSSKGKNAKRKAREFGRDAQLPAKAFGKRVSKKGNVYYEYRDNRADVKQPQPSEKPRLADGGMIESYDVAAPYGTYAKGGEVNKIYNADLYADLRFKDNFTNIFPSKPNLRKIASKNSSKKDRPYGIVIGEGRNMMRYSYPNQEYRDNDFETTQNIINSFFNNKHYAKGGETHTMPDGSTMLNSDHYAKGGKVSKETDYISNRDIVSVTIKKGGKEKTLKGSDILDGIYVSKISNAFGSGAAKKSSKKYEIGIKYPDYDWSGIIKKYNISKSPILKELKAAGNYNYYYQIFKGDDIVISNSYDTRKIQPNGSLGEGESESSWNKLSSPTKLTPYQKEREYKVGFNGGYWGVSTSSKEVYEDILSTLDNQSGGYSKDMTYPKNNLGGLRYKELSDMGVIYAKGGNVGRDGKFLSEEKHEQAYKPKRKKSYKRYKK
tara:strand:+ start:8629 stop:10449 length:1821 start_codon:yes stop_codon:yes gene_type:complete